MRLFVIAIFVFFVQSCDEKTSDQKFNGFKANFLNQLWEHNPQWASWAGLSQFDSLYVLPSEENRKKVDLFNSNMMTELRNYSINGLSDQNKIDYYLIENYLEKSNWYQNHFKSYEWNPAYYNFVSPIGRILNARHTELDLRLKKINALLKYSKEYYKLAKMNLKTATLEHLSLAINRNKGGLGFISGKLKDSVQASNLSIDMKKDFFRTIQITSNDISSYITILEKMKMSLEGKAKSSRIGKKLFSEKYKYDIVTDYSAEEVYQKALVEKTNTHKKMFKLSEELWPKYFPNKKMPKEKLSMVKALIDKISLKHVKREDLFKEIKRQIPLLADFVRKNDLLTQDLDKPLVVRETPTYMRGVAGASISAPGPYEDKSATTYYNVTPLDGYTNEEAESYLREMNHYILQILNMHEAIPGHYTQLIYANKSPSLIKSILGSGAMVEGWANYSVLMMLEEGYKNSPEMWLMRNKWYLRTVCNTIIDYQFHVLNATKDDVINLLRYEAFQEKTEADKKWRRVTLSSVQLSSYFTGITEVYELREEIKSIQKDKFKLKQFHEEFLSYGKAPVKYIRKLMLSNLQ